MNDDLEKRLASGLAVVLSLLIATVFGYNLVVKNNEHEIKMYKIKNQCKEVVK